MSTSCRMLVRGFQAAVVLWNKVLLFCVPLVVWSSGRLVVLPLVTFKATRATKQWAHFIFQFISMWIQFFQRSLQKKQSNHPVKLLARSVNSSLQGVYITYIWCRCFVVGVQTVDSQVGTMSRNWNVELCHRSGERRENLGLRSKRGHSALVRVLRGK